MMRKIKSNKLAKYKVLLMIPAFLLMIFFVACSEEEKTQITSSDSYKTDEVVVVAHSETKNSEDEMYPDQLAYKMVEKMPIYPGGDLGLRRFLATNIKYPQEARQAGISGKVFVKFVVNKEGVVDYVSIARGAHSSLDKEAVRVVKLLSDWAPGEQDGEKVNVWFTVPINFQLQS